MKYIYIRYFVFIYHRFIPNQFNDQLPIGSVERGTGVLIDQTVGIQAGLNFSGFRFATK